MIDYAILAFTSLFTVMNPLSIVPIFVGMTGELTQQQRRATVRRATITSFIILVAFGLGGRFIFSFFGISVNSMRVVGGIILFGIGYEMLGAKLSRTKHPSETTTDYMHDISITPLAMPLMTGPGAIATMILLVNDAHTLPRTIVVYVAAALVVIIIYIVLVSGEWIMARLGEDGNNVLLRVMGLILMVLAIEFIVGGLTPIVREMFLLQ